MVSFLTLRGSRKHILDLHDHDAHLSRLNEALRDTDVTISPTDVHHPRGRSDPTEWTSRRFCRAYFSNVDGFDLKSFEDWWVVDRYRNPQWDLLSTCKISGRLGLLLVEAKAHANELKIAGKPFDAKRSSAQVRLNHERICQCIAEANVDLAQRYNRIKMSCDTHYQLSNRISSTWKLARCGLPVALLYLGFIGDEQMKDVGEPLRDEADWQHVLESYMRNVLPMDMVGQTIAFPSGGEMSILIKSLSLPI